MNSFVLDNAVLLMGDGRRLEGHLTVENADVGAVEAGRYRGALPKEDLHGAMLSPGLIDLMVLGGFNLSILRDDPHELAKRYLRLGVTSLQFCIASLPFETLARIAENTRRARNRGDSQAANILGLYLEGPFQQPDLAGASMREWTLAPSVDAVDRVLSVCGGVVTMMNVAPGLDGDVGAVRRLRQAGKVVSMAHSNASADRIAACLHAGTTVLGHAWDNNSGRIGDSGVQQPTLEHMALVDERVRFIHLICDGTHVHPLLVQLTVRCRGPQSICLVTDAVIRAGSPDGAYTNDDGRSFTKKGGVGRTDTGWLCGSALLLPDHFRNFVRFTQLPPEQAIQTVTGNPAASLGLPDRIGLLKPRAAADLVMWDERLQVKRVWRAGREITDVSRFAEISP